LAFDLCQVYLILDEFILAGELQETSKKVRQNRAFMELSMEFERSEGTMSFRRGHGVP
jgi:hypothetical protein